MAFLDVGPIMFGDTPEDCRGIVSLAMKEQNTKLQVVAVNHFRAE